MAQMTKKRFNALKQELVKRKEQHEELVKELNNAKEQGDLSENAEYETAKQKAVQTKNRIVEIEMELNEAEIMEDDSSPKIQVGSKIQVTKVDGQGKPIAETRTFTLDAKGSTVLDGILGANSPLGQAILNGTSGIYYLPQGGGINYKVQKVIEKNE